MLVAGARTDVRNNNGELPIDLLENVGIIDLQDELRYMLVSNKILLKGDREDKTY